MSNVQDIRRQTSNKQQLVRTFSRFQCYDVGCCLVLNNTKVIPARLYGIKEDTGAKIEILLLKRKEKDIWYQQEILGRA